MDINILNNLSKKAQIHLAKGKLDSVLKIIEQIEEFEESPQKSYALGAILTDYGAQIKDEKIILKAIKLLDSNKNEILKNDKYAPTFYYNLGNGYLGLSKFKKRSEGFFKVSDYDKAKSYLRKSLEYDSIDPLLRRNILTNLGNCYDNIGRKIDALDCYEEALVIDPNYGIALGNKGSTLFEYSPLMQEFTKISRFVAYDILSKALKTKIYPEAEIIYKEKIRQISTIYPNEDMNGLIDSLKIYKKSSVKTKTIRERQYINFCLSNKLYLNIFYLPDWIFSFGDPAFIRSMIVPVNVDKDPFLKLSNFLNHIKQEYVTARFMLFISQYKKMNLDFVDRYVYLIDTMDYIQFNVNNQLLKFSFKNFYDLLDKIAIFINDYLDLGMKHKHITYGKIWNEKKLVVRDSIINTNNPSLNALYDINMDFSNGPYSSLKDMRHILTHRFLNIKMFTESENNSNMEHETFFNKTLELAYVLKKVIIYLLQFIEIEEARKARNDNSIVPIVAEPIPDNLKKYEF